METFDSRRRFGGFGDGKELGRRFPGDESVHRRSRGKHRQRSEPNFAGPKVLRGIPLRRQRDQTVGGGIRKGSPDQNAQTRNSGRRPVSSHQL